MDQRERTGVFRVGAPTSQDIEQILEHVYHALREKGYNPVDQIVGYLLSVHGSPAGMRELPLESEALKQILFTRQ